MKGLMVGCLQFRKNIGWSRFNYNKKRPPRRTVFSANCKIGKKGGASLEERGRFPLILACQWNICTRGGPPSRPSPQRNQPRVGPQWQAHQAVCGRLRARPGARSGPAAQALGLPFQAGAPAGPLRPRQAMSCDGTVARADRRPAGA